MRKIALIKCKEVYFNYGDDCERIIDKITDFEEVTEEQFKAVQWLSDKNGDFSIIELISDQKEKVEFSVKKYVEFCTEQQKLQEAEKAEQERKRLARKMKTDLKKESERKRLFEELKTEFEKDN